MGANPCWNWLGYNFMSFSLTCRQNTFTHNKRVIEHSENTIGYALEQVTSVVEKRFRQYESIVSGQARLFYENVMLFL